MTRRVLFWLALVGAGSAVLMVAALAVVITATSGPELPPPPLPTATAGPGPRSTPDIPLPRLRTATPRPGPQATSSASSPHLPTATAQPGPPSPLIFVNGPVADPKSQLRALAAAQGNNMTVQAILGYENTAEQHVADPPCDRHGLWSLDVNPEGVVGHPFATPPSIRDWARAATAIDVAHQICHVPIVLRWFSHDPKHPASDLWDAVLPASITIANGPLLQHYAMARVRQL